MLTILTIIGLLLLVAIGYGVFTKKITIKTALISSALGMFLLLSNGFWFNAEPGMLYFKQTLGGSQDAVTRPGITWKGFGRITPWTQFLDVKTLAETDLDKPEFDGIEGKMPVVDIRFIDQVTAKAAVSVRFQLPTDEETFKKLVLTYRTQENLIASTLIPTVKQVVSNTGYMFAAQDYISGSASDFRTAISDQLKTGEYSVEKLVQRDTVFNSIKDTTDRGIREIKTSYIVKKREDKNGKLIRIKHDVNTSGVTVDQAIVDDIFLDPDFKRRLTAQRDESAKRQLEQQKIKTAKDAQQRIIAEGERDKAEERVNQEKLQVGELIGKETNLKSSEITRQLALISLETAKINSQATKITADAKAYENKQMVNAGLTPLDREKLLNERIIGVADHVSKINLGQNNTYMMGKTGAGDDKASMLESILGMKLLQQK